MELRFSFTGQNNNNNNKSNNTNETLKRGLISEGVDGPITGGLLSGGGGGGGGLITGCYGTLSLFSTLIFNKYSRIIHTYKIENSHISLPVMLRYLIALCDDPNTCCV